jgi:hypothetical protein
MKISFWVLMNDFYNLFTTLLKLLDNANMMNLSGVDVGIGYRALTSGGICWKLAKCLINYLIY